MVVLKFFVGSGVNEARLVEENRPISETCPRAFDGANKWAKIAG